MTGTMHIEELQGPHRKVFQVLWTPENYDFPGVVCECSNRAEAILYMKKQAQQHGCNLRSAEVIPLRKAVA